VGLGDIYASMGLQFEHPAAVAQLLIMTLMARRRWMKSMGQL